MRSSRYGLSLLLTLSVANLGCPAFAQSSSEWTLSYSDSEGLHKLIYGPPDATGDVYMRCFPDDDFIIILYSVSGRRKSEILSSGGAVVAPPFRVDYSEGSGFVVQLSLPADHDLFRNMANGAALRIVDQVFPVRSAQEQRSIKNFISACNSD